MFSKDASIQCQGSIYSTCTIRQHKAVPLVWSRGSQPQRDGASCFGFLITQCWQQLLGFPSLNVTFSTACLLQMFLKDSAVCVGASRAVFPPFEHHRCRVKPPHEDETNSADQERPSNCCILPSVSICLAWIFVLCDGAVSWADSRGSMITQFHWLECTSCNCKY